MRTASALNRRQRGFTLVEVLVATMLLTMVMTAVYTLFFTVIQSWRSVEQDHGHHRKARNTLALLQREYNNVLPDAAHFMEGDAHAVTLYVVAPPMHPEDKRGPQLMRVRYHFDESNGHLLRDEAFVEGPLPSPAVLVENADQAQVDVGRDTSLVIARGLADVTFRYIWMPRPDGSYWRNVPVTIAPLTASYHRIGWGLPQGLEVSLRYQEDEEAAPYTAEMRLLTRPDTYRKERYQLRNILGDAL